MSAGRKPTPAWLKVVDGNPGRRPFTPPVTKKKSKAADVTPRLPVGTRKEIAVIWRRMMKNAPVGLLTGIDADLLYQWCLARWILAQAEDKYATSQMMLIKTPNGMAQQSPYIGIINRQQLILKQLASELGFTPVARVRLGAEQAADPTEEGSDYFE